MTKKKKEKIDIKPEPDGKYGLYVDGKPLPEVLSPKRKILEDMKRDEYKTNVEKNRQV